MKRNFLFSFFIVAEVILSSGCGTQQEIPKTTAFYQVVDSAGRTVKLEKKPERVVLLATAFPEILLAVDGDFEAWANNPSIKEPAWARGKKTVGYVYDINIESVVAMNPDLVVGLVGLHNKLEAVFKINNIPFLLLSLSRYEDVENAIQVLADSTGHHEKGIKVVTAIRERMAITEKKMPDKGLTCAILHGTARTLTFEGEETIAGETAKALAALFDVTLVFCFEKKGVLRDENDDDSVIPQITPAEFKQYVADGVIQGGMIPKLENSFEALNAGVTEVVITLASAINENSGTRIKK